MKTPIFLICFLLSMICHSQPANKPGYVVTRSGSIYSGQIMEDVKDDHVKIMTSDSNIYNFSYNSLQDIKYDAKPGENKPHRANNNNYTIKAPDDSMDIRRADMNRLHIPPNLIRKRNTGTVLAIVGAVATGIGIGMIAGSPSDAHTVNSPGYSGVNFTGVAAGGFVLCLAGIPTMIVGIIKSAIGQKRINRYIASAH